LGILLRRGTFAPRRHLKINPKSETNTKDAGAHAIRSPRVSSHTRFRGRKTTELAEFP
jgi:hypothetical protein